MNIVLEHQYGEPGNVMWKRSIPEHVFSLSIILHN